MKWQTLHIHEFKKMKADESETFLKVNVDTELVLMT